MLYFESAISLYTHVWYVYVITAVTANMADIVHM